MGKWFLFSTVFQILVGLAAIVAYIIIAVAGEPLGKWTVTLILAVAILIMGIIGVVDWNRSKKS